MRFLLPPLSLQEKAYVAGTLAWHCAWHTWAWAGRIDGRTSGTVAAIELPSKLGRARARRQLDAGGKAAASSANSGVAGIISAGASSGGVFAGGHQPAAAMRSNYASRESGRNLGRAGGREESRRLFTCCLCLTHTTSAEKGKGGDRLSSINRSSRRENIGVIGVNFTPYRAKTGR